MTTTTHTDPSTGTEYPIAGYVGRAARVTTVRDDRSYAFDDERTTVSVRYRGATDTTGTDLYRVKPYASYGAARKHLPSVYEVVPVLAGPGAVSVMAQAEGRRVATALDDWRKQQELARLDAERADLEAEARYEADGMAAVTAELRRRCWLLAERPYLDAGESALEERRGGADLLYRLATIIDEGHRSRAEALYVAGVLLADALRDATDRSSGDLIDKARQRCQRHGAADAGRLALDTIGAR